MLKNNSLHMTLRSNKTTGQLLRCCLNTVVKMCYFTVPSPLPWDVLTLQLKVAYLNSLKSTRSQQVSSV